MVTPSSKPRETILVVDDDPEVLSMAVELLQMKGFTVLSTGEEADRLGRLVDTLLLLSRADAGATPLRPERVDLAALVDHVVDQLEALADEKRQVLSIEVFAPAEAIVDPVILRQALLNLLDNAIKHSPEGGRIRVVVEHRAGIPLVEIIDNGPGIAAEHCEAIFQRFYRVDQARARDAGGVGLGLCLARWAVEHRPPTPFSSLKLWENDAKPPLPR